MAVLEKKNHNSILDQIKKSKGHCMENYKRTFRKKFGSDRIIRAAALSMAITQKSFEISI